MSKELIKSFVAGEGFMHDGKKHKIKTAKYLNGKYIVYTDRKTFVLYEGEFDEFCAKVLFLSVTEVEQREDQLVQLQEEQQTERMQVMATYERPFVHQAEVVRVSCTADLISMKLEGIFEAICDSEFDDKLVKKADAMVRVSNAIVSNEVMRFKYLTIK
jgi:hypothetical protein